MKRAPVTSDQGAIHQEQEQNAGGWIGQTDIGDGQKEWAYGSHNASRPYSKYTVNLVGDVNGLVISGLEKGHGKTCDKNIRDDRQSNVGSCSEHGPISKVGVVNFGSIGRQKVIGECLDCSLVVQNQPL